MIMTSLGWGQGGVINALAKKGGKSMLLFPLLARLLRRSYSCHCTEEAEEKDLLLLFSPVCVVSHLFALEAKVMQVKLTF